RHRPLHVREHGRPRARDGRGPDRRRRRRARDLPAALRGRPAGQARAAGARPERRRALRRRAADAVPAHARGLRGHRRGRELLRGRRRPPPRGRLLDRPRVRRARVVPARPALRAALSDGVLLADKPAGISSHDVVAAERRSRGKGVKIGHAGTLDPFATGLLLILVGRATRAQRWLMALPKRYETVARLGWTSTTGDPEGELAPGRTPAEPLRLPTGRIRQRPPAYSAVRVGGRRA